MSLSLQYQARTPNYSHKTGYRFSLVSSCSSGYESAQSDIRTPTPTNLQAQLPECSAGNFVPTHAHHGLPRMHLCQPEPHKLHSEVSASCGDSLSLCSGSTAFSLHSTAACGDESSEAFSSTREFESYSVLTDSDDNIGLNDSVASVVIHTLKRRSDGWTGPHVKTDPIISRLRRGREEAIRRQEVIEEFLCEASSQLEIQQEASNAQSMCKGSFDHENFEAERLILLARERYDAYMTEAQQMVSEFGQTVALIYEQEVETDSDVPCSATLYLTGIKLILCDDFVRRLRDSTATHYFVCVIKEAKTKGITATQIGSISSTLSSDSTFRIEFNNRFTLPWMPHDFELNIEVYHLVAQPLKWKLVNVINSLVQKSPTIMNKRIPRRCLLVPCVHPVSDSRGTSSRNKERDEPLKSKFEKIGSVNISRSSLKQKVFNLRQQSCVVCAVQVCLQVDPDIALITDDLPLEGYMNVFGGRQWERRWFVLTNHSLSCWLYPDQPEQSEPPVLTWRLSDCGTLPELTDPDSCAWDNSFVLHLRTDHANMLILAAETDAQLNQWMTTLSALIISFNTWKL